MNTKKIFSIITVILIIRAPSLYGSWFFAARPQNMTKSIQYAIQKNDIARCKALAQEHFKIKAEDIKKPMIFIDQTSNDDLTQCKAAAIENYKKRDAIHNSSKKILIKNGIFGFMTGSCTYSLSKTFMKSLGFWSHASGAAIEMANQSSNLANGVVGIFAGTAFDIAANSALFVGKLFLGTAAAGCGYLFYRNVEKSYQAYTSEDALKNACAIKDFFDGIFIAPK